MRKPSLPGPHGKCCSRQEKKSYSGTCSQFGDNIVPDKKLSSRKHTNIFLSVKQGGKRGLRRKVKTQTEILGPNIRYFVAILRFVAILEFHKAFIEL